MKNETNTTAVNVEATAKQVAARAKDLARDYGMNAQDMLWDVVKQWACDGNWTDSERNAVDRAAGKLL